MIDAHIVGIMDHHGVGAVNTGHQIVYHFGKSTTPDRPDQTWVNCLNLFVAGYTV